MSGDRQNDVEKEYSFAKNRVLKISRILACHLIYVFGKNYREQLSTPKMLDFVLLFTRVQ